MSIAESMKGRTTRRKLVRPENIELYSHSTGKKVRITNKETLQAIADCENGKGMNKGFASVSEMFGALGAG
jgi:hypothetical protein